MVYAIFYIFNVLCSLRKSKYIYYGFLLIIFLLIFGLRDGIGVDWNVYELYFNNVSVDNFEIGYKILNDFIYRTCGNFNVLIFCIFSFTTVVQFNALRKFIKDYNIAVVVWLGVGFLAFGILRQAIAISFFMLGLMYFKKDRKKYFIFIIIACLFHNTAIILLPVSYIISEKRSDKTVSIFVIISFLVYIFKIDTVILRILQILPFVGDKINFYLNAQGHNFRMGIDVRCIEVSLLFMIATFFYKDLRKNNSYFDLMYKLLGCYLIFYFGLNSVATIAARAVKYFEIAQIAMFVYLLRIPKDKNLRILSMLCLYVYIGIRYYMTITGGFSLQNNSGYFLPYVNYIQQLF